MEIRDDSSTSRNKMRESVKLEAIYQDADILVINKPYDVPMGKGRKFLLIPSIFSFIIE